MKSKWMAIANLLFGILVFTVVIGRSIQMVDQIGQPTTPVTSAQRLDTCVDILHGIVPPFGGKYIREDNTASENYGNTFVVTYRVDGKQYTKKECMWHHALSTEPHLEMSYNSDNPSEAVVYQQDEGAQWALIGFSFVVGCIGIYSGLFGGKFRYFPFGRAFGTFRGLIR